MNDTVFILIIKENKPDMEHRVTEASMTSSAVQSQRHIEV